MGFTTVFSFPPLDRFGRRPLLLIGSVGMAVTLLRQGQVKRIGRTDTILIIVAIVTMATARYVG